MTRSIRSLAAAMSLSTRIRPVAPEGESGGGRAAAFVVADVGTPGAAEPVAAQRRLGGIHVLMTAGGHSCGGKVETTSAAVLPDLPIGPAVHLHYAETVLRI
jgi:hypothetical protein